MKNYITGDLSQIENQIYAKRREVRYDIRDLTVELIVNKFIESYENIEDNQDGYNLIYVPEYQRDFTWDQKRQSKLIESVILGLPIPFIFVAENKNSTWEIVDGSQRIRTLDAFVKNKLRLNGLQSLDLLNGLKFEDLEVSRKGKFLNTALRLIVMTEETSDEIKKDMFERINRGSDLLKPMEKRKGISNGIFTKFLYKYCSDNVKFKNAVRVDNWLIKRQEREELLLRFFALSNDNIYMKGLNTGLAEFLDKYLIKMDQELAKLTPEQQTSILEKEEEKINSVVEFVTEHFPYGFSHAYNPQTKRSVFEAISIGVLMFINENNILDEKIDKNYIANRLIDKKFKKFTHGANELHKKRNLFGRVNYIYNMLKNID